MIKKLIKKLTAFILCVFLIAAPTPTYAADSKDSVYQKAITTARTEIWKALSSGTASSATVAIMDHGKIVYSEGFGMRDREKSLPVDTNTQFGIGSISKVFTASSILLLCDDGKVKLDNPVTDYLPDFTMKDIRYKKITVRMLLNHSAGFPGTNTKDASSIVENSDYVQETLKVLKESTLKYNPGDFNVYSNDGLTVAQAVIEKISGLKYADFLSKRIFSKLGMNHSSCYFKAGNTNIALQYDNIKDSAYPVEYLSAFASGGIDSTAEDLCRFTQAVYTSKLFKKETRVEFQKAQVCSKTVPAEMPTYKYGLGWDTVSVAKFAKQGVTVLSKNGATCEFNSELYVAPKEKLSVAVIFTGSADTGAINSKIMQSLLEGKKIVKTKEKEVTLPINTAAIPEKLQGFEGYYGSMGKLIKVEFDMASNALIYSVFYEDSFVVAGAFPYKEDGCFYLGETIKLSFTESNGRKYILAQLDNTGAGVILAEQIKENQTSIDSSAFDNKIWVPINLTTTAFERFMVKTGAIEDMPGYIYYYNDGYTAYAMKGNNSAAMCLEQAVDLVEPTIITKEGKTLLQAGGYLFSDAAAAAVLKAKDVITILKSNVNEVRKVDSEAVFQCAIPKSGRIVIFASTLDVIYDSLFDGKKDVIVNQGDSIVFIGDKGTSFATILSN